MSPCPASFLNLDLELDAGFDLSPLAEAIGEQAFVLYSGVVEGGYRLALEPMINGALSPDLERCTEYFLQVLEKLPIEARAILESCTARTFDFGFDGGLEENPLSATLCVEHLRRMSALDIRLRVIVYPHREGEMEQVQ